MTACLAFDIFEQFINATLPDMEAEELLEHLESCPACSERMRVLETQPHDPVIARFAELKGKPIPASSLPSHIAHYKILEKLGEGGMGTVYRALHPHLKREVALKVIRDSRLDDPVAKSRFIQEIQALGKLRHPNIVQAFDAGFVDDDGTPFLVMEFLHGVDLGEHVKRNGKMPVEQAIDCVRQAASGLQHAHENGIIHRDIKPSNLFLLRDGTVKILDLGIARHANFVSNSSQTATGQVVGSPEFMAPEQFRDEKADARSDIYSLGRTFLYLLTGKHDDVSEIPMRCKNMLAKMTMGMPGERFQTMQEVVDAIGDLNFNKTVQKFSPLKSAALVIVLSVAALVFGVVLRSSGVFEPKDRPVIEVISLPPETPSTEPWLTTREIAEHLSVHENTVYRWIDTQNMPAHRAGRAWRFKKSEVDAWFQSRGKER